MSPGGELETVANLQSRLQCAGFDVMDVHAHRPHYALTLAEWSRRLQRRRRAAVALTSERTARVWRVWEVYVAGCAKAFDLGLVGVHQILAGLPDDSGRLPCTLQRCV